ncbi:MAG: arsenate reductase ArsC [Oscillospiraceae bacterium]|nr:arsenate reductase ArsC [Oscillospiraceae bacterium]
MSRKPRVAFVCVHNACRSQMAEAIARILAGDVFDSFSAGTETKPAIDPTAVRLVREQYGVDMTETQYSKTLDALPEVDVVVTMGCNVQCPSLPCRHREDWGLDDPTGKEDSVYLAVMDTIRQRVLELRRELRDGY